VPVVTVPIFRQPIVPHDRGLDVIATKRALHAMGFHRLSLSRVAGPTWEHAVRTVQQRHHLHADGVYGRRTHAVVAKRMDDRAVYLYRHAAIRHRSSGYVNPFKDAHVQIGRIDEGVDYHGHGPILALGDCVVYGLGGGGWPGGHYINLRLTSGRHAGRFVYIAEGVVPRVSVGRRLKAGEVVCEFGWNAAPGLFPGIEFGWSSNVTNLTWASVTHRTGPPPYSNTPPGLAFARFLHAIGCPAPPVGSGPEFV
jgi:hypothetical protein